MPDPTSAVLSQCIGPAPWYWETFPAINSQSGQRFVWSHQEQGEIAYVVSLALEQEPDRPRLALNTYCRPFFVPPANLGIWCPEGRDLRFAVFAPDTLKAFDFADIAGWFKRSTDRIYAATEPLADFLVPITLGRGTHKIDVPPELRMIDELLTVAPIPARETGDPAAAVFICYFQAGLVEVLPQNWFTYTKYKPGYEWITRVARDPVTHRIIGDGVRIPAFELSEDGMEVARWL